MENHQLSKGNRIGRGIYLILLSLFFVSVLVQFLFAGMAVFISPVHWMKHITLIHLVGFNVPLFLLLFAYIGKLPRWAYWHVFGLLVGVFGMYLTANMNSLFPWGGALHPMIAIVLLVISYQALKQTMNLVITNRKGMN